MTTAHPLLLIVPTADEGPATHRLLMVATALAEDPAIDLTVLLWAGGPSAPAFAALGPTIDAGAVNQWRPAQLLARAHLSPGARLLKNRRLRSLLSHLPATPNVLIGGLDALAALRWLPGRPATTTVLVRASETKAAGPAGPPIAVLQEATTVVVCDPDAEDWLLSEGGVAAERIRRHGLLDGPEAVADESGRIGLVGWSAQEVARLAAAVALDHPEATFTWFVEDEPAWALWQGPTASPLAHRIGLAPPCLRTTDLAALAVLLVGSAGPDEMDLAGASRIFGVPVVDLDPRAINDATITGLPTGRPEPRPGWTLSVAAGIEGLRPDWVGTT